MSSHYVATWCQMNTSSSPLKVRQDSFLITPSLLTALVLSVNRIQWGAFVSIADTNVL